MFRNVTGHSLLSSSRLRWGIKLIMTVIKIYACLYFSVNLWHDSWDNLLQYSLVSSFICIWCNYCLDEEKRKIGINLIEAVNCIKNEIAVDKVYQYEQLNEALKDISTKLNLTHDLKLPTKKTKGGSRKDNRHYTEVLNKKESDWIAQFFARGDCLQN